MQREPFPHTKALLTCFVVFCCGCHKAEKVVSMPESASDLQEETSQLEIIPFPHDGDSSWFYDLAHDEEGGTWLIAMGQLYRIEGRDFIPILPHLSSFLFFTGGTDRGLYAATSGNSRTNQGVLFRLRGEVAEKAGTYFRDIGSDRNRPLHITKCGLIVQIGERFLAVREGDGEWNRIGARLSRRQNGVFEVGETTFIYYDNSLYSVEPNGEIRARKCPQWEPVQPGQTGVKGVQWAGTRAVLFFYGTNRLMAFDLESGEPYDLAPPLQDHPSLKFHDAFALKNGEVWFHCRGLNSPSRSSSGLLRLCADGTFEVLPGASELIMDGSNSFSWPSKHVALELSRGEILMGCAGGQLAIYRDGALENWGWKQGILQSIRHLSEASDGSVWFPMEGNIVRLRLAAGLPPRPEATKHWDEIELARGSMIWPLEPGVVGVFRRDQPNSFSRWNGHEWSHQDVLFDRSDLRQESAVDDRGHLLLMLSESALEIGPSMVRQYENMDALLQQVVAEGVRRFPVFFGFGGIIASPEGEITYKQFSGSVLRIFDGNEWDIPRFAYDGRLWVHPVLLHESSRHGVIIKGTSGDVFRADRGQLVELPPLREETHLMINDRGFWPYEKESVDRDPGGTFPVFRNGDRFMIFSNSEDFERSASANFDSATSGLGAQLGIRSVASSDRVRRSHSGGAWIFGELNAMHPRRFIGNEVQHVSFDGTPLSSSKILDVVEDGSGSLWFLKSVPYSTSAFRYTLPVVNISTTTAHQNSGRELKIDISVTSDRESPSIQIFQRVGDAQWQPITKGAGKCVFRFSDSGRFQCEITAFEYGIKLPGSLAFEVEVDVERPETVLAASDGERILVDEVVWQPPVTVRKTTDDAAVDMLWALNDGPWQVAAVDSGLPLVDLKPGPHVVRLAAREEGFWQEERPLEVKIDYRPDYQKFVDQWLPGLLDPDTEARRQARDMFRKVGRAALPALQSRLEEARDAAEPARSIERILLEFGVAN